MEHVPQTRRGRPRKNTITATAAEPIETGEAVKRNENGTVGPAKRRRRASVGGHALKLQAPSRDGFVRRWVNDLGNRVEHAQELAYDFVTDPSTKSTDVGSRVSRLVGTKANGEPLRAYLMETPAEEYQAGSDEKEEHLRQIDEAMTRITDENGQAATPKGEQYGHVSIKRD